MIELLYLISALIIVFIFRLHARVRTMSKNCNHNEYKVIDTHKEETKHYTISLELRKCKYCGKKRWIKIETTTK